MTRLVRLNGEQRAVMESVDIGGRSFVRLDLLQAQPDGGESLMRMLISSDKVESLANALLIARDETAVADVGRSYV